MNTTIRTVEIGFAIELGIIGTHVDRILLLTPKLKNVIPNLMSGGNEEVVCDNLF